MVGIVTGASSGIGRALYLQLKENTRIWKMDFLGVSRRGPDIRIDLTKASEKDLQSITQEPVGLLINCAGIMPFEESRQVFDLNFWAVYDLINVFLPQFIDGTCIINIASISGMIAEPQLPIYAASKAAVLSLTKSLAKKLAPRIRVNAISPGFYNTNLVPGATPDSLISQVPLGYEEHPEKLYNVVKCIYQTKYMTGANIVVDGGSSL